MAIRSDSNLRAVTTVGCPSDAQIRRNPARYLIMGLFRRFECSGPVGLRSTGAGAATAVPVVVCGVLWFVGRPVSEFAEFVDLVGEGVDNGPQLDRRDSGVRLDVR